MITRLLSIAAFVLISSAVIQPASGQMMGGRAGGLADQYSKEAASQVAQRKKFSGSSRRSGHMSASRSNPNYGGADRTGRFDMSGRTPQGYFSARDGNANDLSRYPSSNRRSPRSNYNAAKPQAQSQGQTPPPPRRP